MDSLRSFMDEMLNDQGRKEGFISDLLGNLKNQPIPTLEQAQTGYTTVSNLHGISTIMIRPKLLFLTR